MAEFRLILIVLVLGSCLIWLPNLSVPALSNLPSASLGMPLTSTSWNPATKCNARVLTLEQFIGRIPNPKQRPPMQGADYSGGALLLAGNALPGTNVPSWSWPFSKRSPNPPCTARLANGTVVPTLVEIHGLTVTGVNVRGECGSLYPQVCDETFHLCNAVLAPNCGESYPDSMHMFHAEIDMSWVHFKTAPPVPSYGMTIDVQGFAYWDDGHLRDSWHGYSGWELHPLTWWRPASGAASIAGSFDYNPQVPSVGISTRFTAEVAGGTAPYSYGWNFADGTTITNATQSRTDEISHSFDRPLTYNVTLTIADAKGFRVTVYRFVTVQSAADFDLSSSPEDITMNPATLASVRITATSTPNFSGSLGLVTFAPSDVLIVRLDKTMLTLNAGSTSVVVLQINVSRDAPVGSYPVIVQAISQGAVRVARVNVNVPGFELSVDSSFLEIPPGLIGNFTITVTSLGRFSGKVLLVPTPSSPNVQSIFDVPNLQVAENGYATANLSVSSVTIGSYNITVIGSNDQLKEVLPLTVNITRVDFEMAISPSDLTTNIGQDNSAILVFTSTGGFSGDINITTNSNPKGPVISAPTRVTLSPDAVVPVNIRLSTGSSSTGKYVINLQGTSDDETHSIELVLNIVSNPNQIYYYGGVAAALALGGVLLGRIVWSRFRGGIPAMLHRLFLPEISQHYTIMVARGRFELPSMGFFP